MRDSKNILIDIIKALNSEGIDFIIAGGVAVVLHGVERLTMDLDTAVSLEKENVQKFINVMKNLGLVPRLPVSADVLLDNKKIQVMTKEKNALVFTFIDPDSPVRQVDFFLTNELSYESLKDDIQEIDLEGTPIKVLTKQKLVDLKLKVNPMRDKDLFDIKELQRLILNEQKK